MGRKWDEKEDAILKDLVSKHGKQWALIASHLVHRTPSQVAARWEKCLDPIITKGPFTAEEDNIIRSFVSQNGPRSWPRITELLPNRSSKQCRERWFNHLDPNVTKAQWTYEEDFRIFDEHSKIGGKWSQIAKLLPGRTDNAVKNRWNSSISKRIEIDSDGQKQLLPDSSKRIYKHHVQAQKPTQLSSHFEEVPKPPNILEKEITKKLPSLEIPNSQPLLESNSLNSLNEINAGKLTGNGNSRVMIDHELISPPLSNLNSLTNLNGLPSLASLSNISTISTISSSRMSSNISSSLSNLSSLSYLPSISNLPGLTSSASLPNGLNSSANNDSTENNEQKQQADSNDVSQNQTKNLNPFALLTTPSTSPMPGFALTSGTFGGLPSPSRMPPFTLFSPAATQGIELSNLK